MQGPLHAVPIVGFLCGLHGLGSMDALCALVSKHFCMQVFKADSILNVGEPNTYVSRQQWFDDVGVDVRPCA
jgi:hypothetical protein